MNLFQFEKAKGRFRQVEIGFLLLFLVLTFVLIAANTRIDSQLPQRESPNALALASAMPHQGWAPMTVYFSAFGSSSSSGQIVSYEWDLDGNGLFDTDASQDDGYTSYTYSKPGEYLVTLRVTDEQGGYAVDSLVVNVRHPASSPVDYWTVFDNTQLRRVEVSLTTDNWNLMWADIEAKLTVPADAVVFGEPISNIGFRMRGQFSMRVSGEKKPWKFDFDAYVDGQEYHNLKQLMFINNIGDPSMLREILTYDMMRFAGVNASHACFVEFWIDFTDDDQPPIFWGIYTMIERVDRKFLASRFGQDNRHGNLYKASHAQRGPMDLIYYGPTIEYFPTQNGLYAYGKTTNEEDADYSDIVNLAYVIDGVEYETPEDFAQAAEQVINVDSFLRYMAVMVTVSSWDIYPYTGNNFYLYNNPGTGQFEWIPWDLTWGDNPGFPLFELEGEGLVERAPFYDRVFEVEHYRLQYAAYLDLLARYWFNGENIGQEAQRYYNLIAPRLSQGTGDRMYYGETALFSPELFQDSWIQLANFAEERSIFVMEALASFDE
jgi:PKD repeat protein